jgi:hypothetical protein
MYFSFPQSVFAKHSQVTSEIQPCIVSLMQLSVSSSTSHSVKQRRASRCKVLATRGFTFERTRLQFSGPRGQAPMCEQLLPLAPIQIVTEVPVQVINLTTALSLWHEFLPVSRPG